MPERHRRGERARLGCRRRMVERHLQRIHGGRLTPAQLRREAQRAFDSYARYWVESFRLPELTPEDLDAGCDPRADGEPVGD